MKYLQPISLVLLAAFGAGCSDLEPFQNKTGDSRTQSGPRWVEPRTSGTGTAAESDPSDPAEALTMADAAELVRVVHAIPTGDPQTSALLLEKLTPAEVLRGVDFEYQLLVSNLTGGTLDSVVVEERASSNLTIREANPAPTAGASGASVWELGSLAGGEQVAITVRATALEGTEVQGLAQARYRTALRSTIAVVAPALELDLQLPAVAGTGEDIPLELTVTNSGSGDAREILLTSTLPSGLMTDRGDQEIKVPVGTLAAGESKTVQLMARASQPGEFTAAAEASMRHGVKVTSPSRTVAVREAKLAFEVKGPTKSFIGRPSRWNLKVSNSGGGDASNVVVEHLLPVGMKFVQASVEPERKGDKLVWNLGTVAAGAEKSVDLYLQAEAEGAAKISAQASGDRLAAIASSSEVSLEGISALQLEINDLSDPVLVGDTVTYHVKVYNQGTAPGRNVRLTVQLDEGMQLVRPQGPTPGEATDGRIVFAPYGSLGPDETATWRIVVKSVTAGDLRLSASMTSESMTRPVSENESTQFYQ